jgi:hypothetical protein
MDTSTTTIPTAKRQGLFSFVEKLKFFNHTPDYYASALWIALTLVPDVFETLENRSDKTFVQRTTVNSVPGPITKYFWHSLADLQGKKFAKITELMDNKENNKYILEDLLKFVCNEGTHKGDFYDEEDDTHYHNYDKDRTNEKLDKNYKKFEEACEANPEVIKNIKILKENAKTNKTNIVQTVIAKVILSVCCQLTDLKTFQIEIPTLLMTDRKPMENLNTIIWQGKKEINKNNEKNRRLIAEALMIYFFV